MKIIRCIDVETTSVKDPPESAVCEIGWQDVVMEQRGEEWRPGLGDHGQELVAPGMAIEPEARAVHHISDADVAGKPSLLDIRPRVLKGVDFFAAHNSAYERKYLDFVAPWLCTLKASRRVWPDAPAHGLQVLRYWRGLADGNMKPAHRAGPDAYIGALILIDLIQSGASVRDMVAWEQQPSLLPGAIRLGKHRGTAWRDLPADYLDWIANKSDMDADAKFTAAHWLREMAS